MSLPPEVLETEYRYGLYSQEAADVRVRYLKAFGLWPIEPPTEEKQQAGSSSPPAAD